jgi:hypothetical protein
MDWLNRRTGILRDAAHRIHRGAGDLQPQSLSVAALREIDLDTAENGQQVPRPARL